MFPTVDIDLSRATRLTRALLYASAPFIVLFGLVSLVVLSGWSAVVPHHWNAITRIGLAVLFLFTAAMLVVFDVCLLRQDVLGVPATKVEVDGVRVGETLIRWADIQAIGPFELYGYRFLEIMVRNDAAAGLPWIDRLMWRRRDQSELKRVVVSERQLSLPIDEAVARVERFQPRYSRMYSRR